MRKNTAKGLRMIRYKSTRQLNLKSFSLPFGGKLNSDNHWIKLRMLYRLPWKITLSPDFCVTAKNEMTYFSRQPI